MGAIAKKRNAVRVILAVLAALMLLMLFPLSASAEDNVVTTFKANGGTGAVMNLNGTMAGLGIEDIIVLDFEDGTG